MSCEDQACPPTDACTKFECQTWDGDTPVKPKLVKRGLYWCCPTCGASYGENPFADGQAL